MNKQSPHLVFIPGFMLNESLWDDMLEYFPEHWNIHKASLEQGHSIEEIVENIVKNAPKKFILIGFSLGGYIARFLINQYPERVSALILIASSIRHDTEEQKNQKIQAINAMSKKNFKGLSGVAISQTLHPSNSQNHYLIQRIQKMGDKMGYETFVTLSLLERTFEQHHVIKCPTLIIYGAQDRLRCKEQAIELMNMIPQSDLERIESTGHIIPLEQPEKLAITINDWLNKHGIVE
ncbi:alpha/beta hydrolase [Acinetobacter qingfengensis]|uniref:Alpha/beta hydrolase n=1 Tax=Acinetobacter qingfengensis TaxID=1262585 RepID=A0A1E7R5F0_9GAMM|nr:alpha/beta hydrolase [Acinetobacter qingfengensis]KAA8733169.1 alpha/beta hydrolase [Acinetobacter qingfengensis]OEY94554.1 alpha/beta hydrolase [Acinetobacter qingfengensis]